MWTALVAIISALLKFFGLKRSEVKTQAEKVEVATKAGVATGVVKMAKVQERVILDQKVLDAKAQLEALMKERP